ncbi:MAG: VWA domain-containing protein [Candidatus Bathyarchaeota archaeon]
MSPRSHPCSDFQDSLLELLRDAARMQMGQGLDHDSEFMERARERAEERFREAQERISQLTEELKRLKAEQMQRSVESLLDSGDLEKVLGDAGLTAEMQGLEDEIEELRKEPQGVSKRDYNETLRDLEEKGLVEKGPHTVRLTSRGARVMGQGFLTRILLNLERRGLGPHKIEDIGAGAWTGATVRPYEPGDPYHRINIERTLLAALERGAPMSSFTAGDFRVWEPLHSTELHFGVLVDQSASMRKKRKLEAAVETALALSELMMTLYPEDRLRVIAFSEEVREVEPWMLTAATVPMKFTDIRAALRAFRSRVIYEPGNKQCHLVTDTAPNFLDGEFVGFTRAMAAVIDEARLYRMHGIVLNVIMLDDDPQLREMAQRVARENLGRVAYVNPENLGEAVVEDYLSLKSPLTG